MQIIALCKKEPLLKYSRFVYALLSRVIKFIDPVCSPVLKSESSALYQQPVLLGFSKIEKYHTKRITQIIIKMKMTIAILLVACLQVSASGYAQKITLSQRDAPIEQVLKEIKKQTGYLFFYNHDWLKQVNAVNIHVRKASIEQVLDICFNNQPLVYSIVDKTIVLSKREPVTDKNDAGIEQQAPPQEIRGQVTDSKGETLPGVSIKLKGTTIGATTDLDGRYTINVPDNNSVLVFTYIGYVTQEIVVNGRTSINVKLEATNTALNEIVVTAFGISREKKALAYAVTEVKGEDFTQSRENNIANALTGKIAGVNATGMASGPGGSSRVIIRGNGSLSGDNQPLYVINGMPMSNTHREQRQGEGGTVLDRGDGIAAINPDDIESITVLKGGPAAALYGSGASNGVILITTKKGKTQQGVGIELNSNFSVGSPSMYPDYQYEYGQGINGVRPITKAQAVSTGRLSWGEKMDGKPYVQLDGVMRPYSAVNVKDNWKNFYRPSTNMTNTVAFSGGNSSEFVYRLSLSDLEAKALEPGSSYNRQSANLSMRSVLGKRFTVESTLQYNLERGINRPGSGYADNSTSWALNLLANTLDVRYLAPGYDANFNEIVWNQAPVAQNPYFIINRMGNKDSKNRFMGMGSVQYSISDNLFVKVSGMRDIDSFESMDYMPLGTARFPSGLFNSGTSFVTKTTGQALINYNTSFLKDFQINAIAGGNIEKNVSRSTSNNGSEFIAPDFISYLNLKIQNASVGFSQYGLNSVFGSADLSYKGLFYLTFTGRQDWFSVLNPGNNSIFYPSVGASFILSDALKMPAAISFVKLRASWAQVGGATVNPYQINQLYTFAPGGHIGRPFQNTSSSLSNPNLRPLTSTTYEGGIDLQFLDNRLGLDFTYYNRKTTDDILNTTVAVSSGYTSVLLNVGELSNKGVELLLTGQPVKSDKFNWNISYNAAYNKSEILKLAPGVTTIGGSGVGSPYNTLRGRTYLTNTSGQRVYNKLSGYEVQGPEIEYGQGVPPYTMGLNNNFRYKNWSLDVLIDGKFGNIVQSLSSYFMHRFGLHKSTLPGRENGLTVSGVDQDGQPFTKTWPVNGLVTYHFNQVNISPLSYTVFDDSFVKLRSTVLSYRIPVNKLQFVKIQSADFSLGIRNLAILYSKITDFDPEFAYTVGNNQTQSSNTLPRTRDIGFNLLVKF